MSMMVNKFVFTSASYPNQSRENISYS
jgi:hypothetical protein